MVQYRKPERRSPNIIDRRTGRKPTGPLFPDVARGENPRRADGRGPTPNTSAVPGGSRVMRGMFAPTVSASAAKTRARAQASRKANQPVTVAAPPRTVAKKAKPASTPSYGGAGHKSKVAGNPWSSESIFRGAVRDARGGR